LVNQNCEEEYNTRGDEIDDIWSSSSHIRRISYNRRVCSESSVVIQYVSGFNVVKVVAD
jgi:hypothetical protein